jgi:hypothetical protein
MSAAEEIPPPPVAIRVDVACIPAEMRSERRWLGWKYLLRPGAVLGVRRWTKVPFQPHQPHIPASSTDLSTWGTFLQALQAYQRGDADGLGFALGDGWAGVDLDHVVDPETGRLAGWAQDVVDAFATYTEVSPSGTGVHLLLHGGRPHAQGHKRGDVEVYWGARYLTVTGCHLDGTLGTVEARQEALDAFCARYFAPVALPSREFQVVASNGASLDDEALIEKALAANDGGKFAALWDGDTRGYPSPSEAVAALLWKLVFWAGRNPVRVDQLFRRSGLMSPKWDSRRGNTTWGALEIASAIERVRDVYVSPVQAAQTMDTEPKVDSALDGAESPPPRRGTDVLYRLLTDVELEALEPARGIIGDVLFEDCIAYLFGESDTWKTFIAVAWSLCLAAEMAWLGHEVRGGPVIYVAAEGGRGLAKRVTAWKQHHRIRTSVDLLALPMPVNLLDPGAMPRLVASIRAHPQLGDRKPVLIVFDTLARSMDGGDENGTMEANAVTSAASILRATFGCCVLVVHHSGKDPGRGMRGNSALKANADVVIRVVAPALPEGQRRKPGDVVVLHSDKSKDNTNFDDIFVTTAEEQWAMETTGEQRSSLVIIHADKPLDRGKAATLIASQQQALDTLALAPSGFKAGEWEKASGLPGTTFHEARRKLSDRGFVALDPEGGTGRYQVTASGWENVSAEVRAQCGRNADAPPML